MSVSNIKLCSKCKVSKGNSCFGYKTNGNEYKTCTQGRSRNAKHSDKFIKAVTA